MNNEMIIVSTLLFLFLNLLWTIDLMTLASWDKYLHIHFGSGNNILSVHECCIGARLVGSNFGLGKCWDIYESFRLAAIDRRCKRVRVFVIVDVSSLHRLSAVHTTKYQWVRNRILLRSCTIVQANEYSRSVILLQLHRSPLHPYPFVSCKFFFHHHGY